MRNAFFSVAAALALALILPFSALAQEGAGATDSAARTLSPEQAFTLLAGEAEKGNPQAMLNLGNMYEQGLGMPRNFLKAREWYNKAAKAGLPEGMYNMGVCYEIGLGTSGDMLRAVEFYQQAANLNMPQALYKLAALHAAGSGVPQSEEKAFDYLGRAAKAGHVGAMMETALVYLDGALGQAKNGEKALEYFRKAADVGNLEAAKNMAVMYKDGLGVAQDKMQAYKWYVIAVKGGFQGNGLEEVLAELRKELKEADMKKAEQEADKWLSELAKKAG